MDIRSFFGGKAKPKEESAATSKKRPVDIKNKIDADELNDSDEDFQDQHSSDRKRLRIKPGKPVGKEVKSTSPSLSKRKLPGTASTIELINSENDLIEVLEDGPSKKKGTCTGGSALNELPAKSKTPTKATLPALHADLKGKKSPGRVQERERSLLEIAGGASAFFGGGAAAITAKPADKQKTSSPTAAKRRTPQGKRSANSEEGGSDDNAFSTSDSDRKWQSARDPPPKSPLYHAGSLGGAGRADTMPPLASLPITARPVLSSEVRIPSEESGEMSSVPPQGAPNCLEGYKVACTGVMGVIMSRDDIEGLILQYGGKVAKSVSGKTTLLIASGLLDDGRDPSTSLKYRNAQEKKVTIVTEKQFLLLIQNTFSAPQSTAAQPRNSTAPAPPSRMVRGSSAPSFSSSSSSACVNAPGVALGSLGEASQQLWVDKYRPNRLEDIIGSADSVKKLLEWLRKWHDVHIKKLMKVPFMKDNPGAKAVLMSGPPGIGKTTLANLVARSLGYEVLELNASDVRSKKAIEDQVKDVVLSQAMRSDGSLHRRLVIMDEVDGMGGSDRGGIPELIKVIKAAKNPIICVCNERQERKIKSLANHCFDIRVKRPTKQTVAGRLVRIGQAEGLTIEPNAAELLVEQMGNDIRQVINAAQMWKAQSDVMRYVDLAGPGAAVGERGDQGRLRSIQKDKILRQSPFEACGLILGGKKCDLNERYNSFFIDYSLIPLLVEQNYVDSARNGIFRQAIGEDVKMDQLAAAAEAASDMDLISSRVMGNDMHWELLPAQAAACLRVGSLVQGFQSFPTFPAWLGKNSSTGKSKRQTQEIVTHTSVSVGQGFESVRLEYIPYLRNSLLQILKTAGTDTYRVDDDGNSVSGVTEVINILDEYGLSRDDLMETMKDLQLIVSGDKETVLNDKYASLDAKLKAAFTRQYNAGEHRSQALVEEMLMVKKRRGGASGGGDEDDLEEGTTEDLAAARADEEEDEEAELEAFMKKHSQAKRGAGGGAKKKAATKKSK